MKTPATLALALLLAPMYFAQAEAPAAVSGDVASSRAWDSGAEPPSVCPSPCPRPIYELRPASAARALLRDIHDPFDVDDGTPLDAFVASLDLHAFVIPDPLTDHPVYVIPLPADPAFSAALAAQDWELRSSPDDPDQVYADGDDLVFVSRQPSHILLSYENPLVANAAALLPYLPDTLSADGIFVVSRPPYHPSHDYVALLDDPAVTCGVALDGDTVVVHMLLSYPDDSPISAWLRAIPSIPGSTACVNLPGALATLAIAPLPPLPANVGADDLPREVLYFLSRHPRIPFSLAILPPAPLPPPGDVEGFDEDFDYDDFTDRLSSALSTLAFAGFPDPSAPLRALSSVTGPLATYVEHRGVAIQGLSEDADFEHPDDTLPWQFLDSFLFDPIFPDFAALPTGVLVAGCGDTNTFAAIDAALDGNLPAFDQSPAFRGAFPSPDAPPVAILHADIRALADAYPGKLFLDPDDLPPGPLPVDAFLHVAPDASLVLRARIPLALLQAM